VRGRHQTIGRGSRGAWAALALALAATATPLPGTSRAQDPADGEGESAPLLPSEPVLIGAQRVRVWSEGEVRWAYLAGQAAAAQAGEGLRAEVALARIVPEAPIGGSTPHRIEIYAEGNVRDFANPRLGRRRSRLVLRTTGEVRLKAYDPDGMKQIEAPPANLALRHRGFPDPEEARLRAQPFPGNPPSVAAPSVAETPPPAPAPAAADGGVVRAQFVADDPPPPGFEAEAPLAPPRPDPAMPDDFPPPTDLEPLEGPSLLPPGVVVEGPAVVGPVIADPIAPILPGSQRSVTIGPRDGPTFRLKTLPTLDDGTVTIVATGGVAINVTALDRLGTIEIAADSAIVWTRSPAGGGRVGVDGSLAQGADEPLEIYLEGNVVFRQDKLQVAGNGDQTTYRARRFYADLRTQRLVALEAELDQFAPGLVAPIRTLADRIMQYKPTVLTPKGEAVPGPARIFADRAITTGSRFANPGYRFSSSRVELTELSPTPLRDPQTGRDVPGSDRPDGAKDTIYRIDARNNFFFLGSVPVFYWPRILTTSEDIDPPIEQIQFRVNNIFGTQLLTDWNGFKLFGLEQPRAIDSWNVDIDYLSDRGFALGSEIGYFGRDLDRSLFGRDLIPGVQGDYFGYLDFWGLKDAGVDNLGGGPAIVTDGPRLDSRGIPFQRNAVPPPVDFRGRAIFRHMHSLVAADADPYEDFRVQFEAAYLSDRNFLEQYYKRLFDTGLDQSTLLYLIRQRENRALTFLTEANLQTFYTESQWFPKVDYYHLGDAPFGLGKYVSYFQNSGVDYANTHTASEVNNPTLFGDVVPNNFIPYDPVSLTSNAFRTGRIWTSHEVDVPIDLGLLRVVPYAQGQLVGWDNQYADPLPTLGFDPALPRQAYIRGPQGSRLGRAWGGVGARADVMAHRIYPGVESELLNLHGLNHKVDFSADFRTAYSTEGLERIGIQDDLDDNTYEFVRRNFALINYTNGLVPAQYSPVLLTLRRTSSPITGTVDVQDDLQTLKLAVRQRLQTKRGPEGKRRIVDVMAFDVQTTYFPQSDRDNFGKPFGQNMYYGEYFIGDRTSFVSSGWFEFFDIGGQPLINNPDKKDDPFSFLVVTSGFVLNRPPRGNLFVGYTIIDTGPIATSALNTSANYWLSPKWYGTAGTVYDFGNAILLGTTFSVTRVGADFLTSVGVTINPLQDNYSFNFELVPRLSPNVRLGSGPSLSSFDSRFAPVE